MLTVLLFSALADEPALPPLALVPVDDEQGLATAAYGALDTTLDDMRAVAEAEGFTVPSQEPDRFGRTTPVRFALGGELAEARCKGWVGAYGCEIGIKWQLLDTRRDQVVYEGVGRGFATDVVGTRAAARRAVTAAMEEVLRRPGFRAALTGVAERPVFEAELAVRRCGRAPVALPKGVASAMQAAVEVKVGDVRGMGVVVSPDGFVLTAAHVVRGAESADVRDASGTVRTARVLRRDAGQDVAILLADGHDLPCLALDERPSDPGADLWVLGAPRGDESFSIMRGVVSATRTVDGVRLLQTDAAVNPGDSGGAMLDGAGAIRAVVSMKVAAEGWEGIGFGIPVGAALDRLGVVLGAASDADPPAKVGNAGAAPSSDPPNTSGYEAWVQEQTAAAAARAAEEAAKAKGRRR